MKKSKKILNFIKNLILDVIIILLIVAIIFGFLNRNKPVSILKHYLFTVMSGSMQPELMVGDSIIVKEVNEYTVNDIVTYKKDTFYVTHRIVSVDGDKVVTKGDANTSEDDPIDKKDILGKVVYKGKLLNFVVNNKIMIALFIIIIYLIVLILKPEKGKENKNEKEKSLS